MVSKGSLKIEGCFMFHSPSYFLTKVEFSAIFACSEWKLSFMFSVSKPDYWINSTFSWFIIKLIGFYFYLLQQKLKLYIPQQIQKNRCTIMGKQNVLVFYSQRLLLTKAKPKLKCTVSDINNAPLGNLKLFCFVH